MREAAAFDEAEALRFAPDLIVVACDSPDRDTLESLREAGAVNPRPIVMFVDRSQPGLAEAAIQAGVAAYVVDKGRANGAVASDLIAFADVLKPSAEVRVARPGSA